MTYGRKGTLNSNRKNVSSNTSDNTIRTRKVSGEEYLIYYLNRWTIRYIL